MAELQSNLAAASKNLQLTPQEQNLYQHHWNNLTGNGKVINPDGSISTVYNAVVTGPNEQYYSIPTIWNGKALPVNEAANMAAQKGWENWPSYATPEAADARYDALHQYMGEDMMRYMQQDSVRRDIMNAIQQLGGQP